MVLRGIEFGTVCNASGARGFFGETASFQWQTGKPPAWEGSTFVAKTATLNPKPGNMPMQEDGITAQEQHPACIVVREEDNLVLNSVGLTGPGIVALLNMNRWQQFKEPFFLSFMSVTTTAAERIEELRSLCKILKPALKEFQAPVALQINFSCPNIGLHLEELQEEVEEALNEAAVLNIPLVPKFNLLLPVKTASKILEHPACDALCVTNTIPWGEIFPKAAWQKFFDAEKSPLAHLGGGGLSGKPLLPLLLDWLKQARKMGITKPILAGGGILSAQDAAKVLKTGGTAISLGVISILHPENVKPIINTYGT